MQTGNLVTRIKRAEQAAKAQAKFSSECICFPPKEPPRVGFPIEEEIAARVKCPLHEERFKTPQFHIYVPKWLREKLWKVLYSQHSEQYRKAWFASFPPDLWPAEEDETDGTTLPEAEGWNTAFGVHKPIRKGAIGNAEVLRDALADTTGPNRRTRRADIEREIASRVKCPVHGERTKTGRSSTR
jgi:hypothetical protein